MKFTDKLLNTALGTVNGFGKAAPAAELPDGTFDHPDRDGSGYTAGFGMAPFLPEDIEKKKYYIAGYGENNPARGVIDPQYAVAVWLDDGTGRGGNLFLTLDVVGLLSKDVDALKDALKDFRELTGCRGVTVTSTHNHAGIDTMGLWGPLPLTGRNPKFIRLMIDAAVSASVAAYQDRRPGKLFFGSVRVPDMQEDIRTPEVYSDRLSRFRFVPADGSREIWMLNFASHSESLQGCNHLVSADFPGYLREKIRNETGAQTLYAVGAIGGMISMKIDEENLLRKEHRLLESTRNIGARLGEYAISIREETELAPRISRITQPFYVKAENPLLTVAGQVGIIKVDRYRSDDANTLIKTQMTYMEIGGVKTLFLPCELFPELAYGGYLSAEESATGKGSEVNPAPLTELAGDENLLICGLADDELGYVLPPNDFLLSPDKPYLDRGIDKFGRRHYEETNSTGPETAQTIADTFAKVMGIVRETKGKF